MGVPVVFGYVMPAILTGVIKRWRFTSGPRLGPYRASRLHLWLGSPWRCLPSSIVRHRRLGARRGRDQRCDQRRDRVRWLVARHAGGCAPARSRSTTASRDCRRLRRQVTSRMGATYAAMSIAAHRVLIAEPGAAVGVSGGARDLVHWYQRLCSSPSIPPTRQVLRDLLARKRSRFNAGG